MNLENEIKEWVILDNKLKILVSLTKQFPKELWIHATLIFEAMQARSVDELYKDEIMNSKRILMESFPYDPLVLTCSKDEKKRETALISLPPSLSKYVELHRMDMSNSKKETMVNFWGAATQDHPKQEYMSFAERNVV